jgi:peptidoglycan/LPS O-acetylase OafA/YrhL
VVFHFRLLFPPTTPQILQTIAAQGYIAVDLFFVLSGFVITLNYGAWFARPSRQHYVKFLALRLARIYPLHAVMLLLYLLTAIILALLSRHPTLGPDYNPTYFLLSVFLLQNWGFTNDTAWNVPAWSISTEWFAYLIFPLLAVALPALTATPRRALLSAAALAATLALGMAATGLTLRDAIPHGGLFRCVTEFALGGCALRLHQATTTHATAAAAIAAACFTATVVFHLPDYALCPFGFAALIVALASAPQTQAAGFFEWLGEISYSTYLAHYLIKVWIKLVLVRPGIPLSLALAAYLVTVLAASIVLYRCVELPGRTFLRRRLKKSVLF